MLLLEFLVFIYTNKRDEVTRDPTLRSSFVVTGRFDFKYLLNIAI